MSIMHAQSRAALVTVALCLSLVLPVHAAISTIGDVAPDPNTTTGSDDLLVGDTAAGTMLIDSGSDVTSRDSYIGDDSGIIGTVIVDGSESTWTNDGNLTVGNSGIGMLAIARGGQVSDYDGSLGYSSGSTGIAIVDGAGSTWTNGRYLTVGYDGTGKLDITDGGNVTSVIAALGLSAGSSGTVNVGGAGSTWTDNTLIIGLEGTGTLTVVDGGYISNGLSTIGYSSNSEGVATVDGAGSSWDTDGQMKIGLSGNGRLDISNGGLVRNMDASVGDALGSTGVVSVDGAGSTLDNFGNASVGKLGNGRLDITGGGTVVFRGSVSLGSASSGSGTISLQDGTLWLYNRPLTKGLGTATFNFDGGRLQGATTINLGANLVQNGGTLAPGNVTGTTTILGGYTLDAGTLEIEINGPGSSARDQLNVSGTVDLLGADGQANAVLDVILGFPPMLGSQFNTLGNDGSDAIIGTFAQGSIVRAPYNDSLYEFAINYTAGNGNDVVLQTQAVSLLGDYNEDGMVDGADYSMWHDLDGQSVPRYSSADGSGDGVINEADFEVWRENYGNTFSEGSGAATASVPEPATLILAAGSLLFVMMPGNRRRGCAKTIAGNGQAAVGPCGE